MSQSKKIFTRMCLNNWGGINHKVLQFNEYVNLFSGKSGSGKINRHGCDSGNPLRQLQPHLLEQGCR